MNLLVFKIPFFASEGIFFVVNALVCCCCDDLTQVQIVTKHKERRDSEKEASHALHVFKHKRYF